MNTQQRQERHLQRIQRHKENIAKLEARLGALPEHLRGEQMKVIEIMKSRLEMIDNDIRRM
ncbi:hypothetical protein [Brevibacillus formosus]|uniref:hypothetical protein n=1 Tax=Brevibacillus formosus TaxID=54913 RepID=UPI003F1D0C4D